MIQAIIDEATIQRLRAMINGVQRIAITCHKSPDGDALGSTLALCHVLRRLGKEADVVTPDMAPRALEFIPGVRDIIVFTKHEARARRVLADAQLIFCLDYNSLHRIDRLGELIEPLTTRRVLIDHHLDPEDAFDLSISFPEASSTCELVFRVLMQMGLLRLMDRHAASCLYVGLLTDTGGFAYSCDNPELYEILASIMRRHIDRVALYNKAMNTFSADSMRLQGYAINEKMQLFPEHGASLITLDKAELERFNYNRGDTETLVNKPLAIPGIYWSVFLREDADRIKVSCRSQGDFSVSDICARYFNGGGHENAAGGEFNGSIDEAVQVFYQVLADLFPDIHPQQQPTTNDNNEEQ
ncbi:MAG: DHH family phosphoesterase [Muribaculaceae bacterium]|nr:DHH family phosphoesterase [Muribaculaceae bacterium]MBR6948358.1 DHH family phosphoesterase [Muribaculaceae bacterium]